MVATVLSAVAGAVVAALLAVGGTHLAEPSVSPQVPASQMVKYGDNGHL